MDLLEQADGAVVVGVDGSQASEQAIDWAAEQAVLEGRPLTLVHATGVWSAPPEVDLVALVAAMEAQGDELVSQARARVEAAHVIPDLRSQVVLADPRAALLDASEVAYLTVIGSRGRGAIKTLVLGSVGLTLSQQAHCPVVVRRPHDAEDTGDGLVVGTDLSRHSEVAVDWAFHQAVVRGLPLTLVHTVFDGYPAGVVPADDTEHEDRRARLVSLAERFGTRHPGVEVQCELRRGIPDEALVEAAAGSEMVVVGSHQRRSVLSMMDLNVPKTVIERAPRFVAVVPGPGTTERT
nr:universal stress protein [Nocardioides houyundeii]